jgi:REP element-mobilizing transposase RayT
MVRKIRLAYAGALYHVMARGNQGRDIYAEDRDRNLWLETPAESWERTGWRLHAWVMMSNHYHLLLETPEATLPAGMKWFQGAYTQRYNSRHGVFGRLYQGRCKALVVDRASWNSALRAGPSPARSGSERFSAAPTADILEFFC